VHYGKDSEAWEQIRLSSFLGALPERGYIGSNVRADYFRVKNDQIDYRPNDPMRQTDRNVYLLYSAKSSELLAIIYGGSSRSSPVEMITNNISVPMRTAACTGLATKWLARGDSSVLGFFGAGFHAPSTFAAVCQVLPLKRARIYSPTPSHRSDFAQKMSKITGVDTRAVDEPESAVRGCDVVVTCTNSRVPVFDGTNVEGGTHIAVTVAGNKEYGFGRREIDDEVVAKSSRIVVNSKEQLIQDEHATLMEPVKSGLISLNKINELSEVVSRTAGNRASDTEITLYHNNAGQGVADLAIAATTYELAKELHVGKEIPL
jgi:ornithine cyclodeaminase/alanine dehydrogenase-like protein (mu-crystallin family)